jgi:pimeloyl-ACP methyl ester carboxylesterase
MNLDAPPFSSFRNEGLDLAYFDDGDPAGSPILLIHGFASSANVNWVYPGWLRTLGDAGYRVIAIDNRGHGSSDKPHDPEAYHPSAMAGDACDGLFHGRTHFRISRHRAPGSCALARLRRPRDRHVRWRG